MTPRDLLLNALCMIECYRAVPGEVPSETFIADLHMVLQAAWKVLDGHIEEPPQEVLNVIAAMHAGFAIGEAMRLRNG